MSWKKISSVDKYKNKYLTVTEDELVTDHGDRVTYGIVHKEPAVIVIPWENESFTLIGQYRYAVDGYSWEFPAGHHEHESVEETARVELEEETGLRAGRLQEIGTFYVAPGHLTQVCHVFVATGLSQGERRLEPSEKGMQVKKASLGEIYDMVAKGEIKDGLTISALKLFELHR